MNHGRRPMSAEMLAKINIYILPAHPVAMDDQYYALGGSLLKSPMLLDCGTGSTNIKGMKKSSDTDSGQAKL